MRLDWFYLPPEDDGRWQVQLQVVEPWELQRVRELLEVDLTPGTEVYIYLTNGVTQVTDKLPLRELNNTPEADRDQTWLSLSPEA